MLVWVFLVIIVHIISAEECPNSCGTPEKLSFCHHINFPVCRTTTAQSWHGQDDTAKEKYTHIHEAIAYHYHPTNQTSARVVQMYHNLSEKLPNLFQGTKAPKWWRNSTSECNLLLRRLECAVHFPVCEIGSDFDRLCLQSCHQKVVTTCPQLNGLCTQLFQGQHLLENTASCFDLDYDGPQVGMWVAGFSIALVFSVLNSVGINLQKYSLSRNENVNSFKQPLWVVGFTLICLGSILDFVAFGMAPQTLLAPLAALSLVWNMFIAPIFHKEKITKRNIIATVIIFTGVSITVIFAGHSTPQYELEDLILLYQQPVMYAYVTCVTLFLILMLVGVRVIESKHYCEGGLLHVICYGGIAGTFGGQSVLLAKSTVELLKSAIWGKKKVMAVPSVTTSSTPEVPPFYRIEPYCIIASLVFCLIMQISFLNGGLKRFDALVMVPVYQSFWILMSVLGGIMYFEEYVSMTSIQTLVFPIGGFITISGIIYLLQDRRHSHSHPAVKYSELGKASEIPPTPTSAWSPDDSDEEAAQTHLDMNLEDDFELIPVEKCKKEVASEDGIDVVSQDIPAGVESENGFV